MIKIENNERYLHQWSLNKRVIVDGFLSGTKVEFSRRYDCKESALPTVAYAEGDHTYANIPNILLQAPGYIRVLVRPSAADSDHMPEVADFKIVQREKPEDYAYTETPTETLDNKVDKFWGEENKGKALVIGDDGRVQAVEQPEAGGEVDPEAIEDAVEKYLTENPPAGGAASEKVWKVLNEVTVSEVVDSVTIDADSDGKAFSAKHLLVHMYLPKYEYEGNTGTGYSTYAINGKTIGRLGYCYPASKWENGYFLFDIMACGDLVYVRCYKEAGGAYLSEGRTLEQIFHFAINENVGLYEGIFSFKWSLFNRKVLPGSTFKVYGEVS